MPIRLCLAFLFLSTAGAAICRAADDPVAPRPNIVILLCDDLGYGDLHCFGHPHIQTPNLDALASGGIRFTACYSAAPVCSPSRAGLLTGRSPNRAGIYDWIPEYDPAKNPKPNSDDHRERVHLQSSETTVASALRDAGYRTAMAGKWHCNAQFNSPNQPGPREHGFEHWLATQNNAAPSHKNPTNFVRNGTPIGPVESFSCQYVIDESIQWLSQPSDKPFFLYVPFHEPHLPIASPPELIDQYRSVSENADQAEYFANVANVDLAVGRLVTYLKTSNQFDNTMIVFTSDNGPETKNRYRGTDKCYGVAEPLRGRKLHTTDGGFRVPGIVHWTNAIPGGRTVDTPVSSLDLMPTLCEIGGASPGDRRLDGQSLTRLIQDDSWQRDKPLLWTYYNSRNEHQVAMRHRNYKVLAKIQSIKKLSNLTASIKADVSQHPLVDFEIYDVSQDIDESENLLGKIDSSNELQELCADEYQGLLADSPVW